MTHELAPSLPLSSLCYDLQGDGILTVSEGPAQDAAALRHTHEWQDLVRRVLSGGVSGQSCMVLVLAWRPSNRPCFAPAQRYSVASNKLVSLRSLIHCHALPGLARLSILSSYAHGVRCQGADATLSSFGMSRRADSQL